MMRNFFCFIDRNQALFLISTFFVVAIFYHYIVAPFRDTPPGSKSEQIVSSASQREIDIDYDYPEKTYAGVFDARNGDTYRIGVRVYSERETVLEVLLRSDFDETFKIGEWKVPASKEGVFEEIVFMSPNRFSDVILRLKKNTLEDDATWKRNAVSLDSFFVTRLDVKTWSDIAALEKTEYAVSGITPARLEDIGKDWFYIVSLVKNHQLVENLFSQSDGVTFDEKKGLISGKRKKGEHFVYKFDMKHPFERLVLNAEQGGEDSKELLLEHSLDGESWKQVDYTQKKGESQKFHLVLSGLSNQGIIFVRVAYSGEEKEKGSFSLKSLTLEALLPNRSK